MSRILTRNVIDRRREARWPLTILGSIVIGSWAVIALLVLFGWWLARVTP
jgi:hypothetical protein